MKSFRAIALAAAPIFLLSACGSADGSSDNASDFFNSFTESSEVQLVKDGYVKACPSASLGEMADAFMVNPEWSDFVSDSGESVVELTGGISYQSVPATARLQFLIDESAGTFEAYWLGIDDEGQSVLTLGALLSKMCDAALGA